VIGVKNKSSLVFVIRETLQASASFPEFNSFPGGKEISKYNCP
jgi:hypothetical protein